MLSSLLLSFPVTPTHTECLLSYYLHRHKVKDNKEKQTLPTVIPSEHRQCIRKTINHKMQPEINILWHLNCVVCSSNLMIGFFITCLIILTAVMFVSTVYCCFGVSSLCLWWTKSACKPDASCSSNTSLFSCVIRDGSDFRVFGFVLFFTIMQFCRISQMSPRTEKDWLLFLYVELQYQTSKRHIC